MFRPMVTVPFQPTIPLPVTVVMPSVALTTAVAPTSAVTTMRNPPRVPRLTHAGADTPGAAGATVFFTNVVATGPEPSVGVMVTASTASDSPERSRTAGSMPSPPTVPDPVIALTPSETL